MLKNSPFGLTSLCLAAICLSACAKGPETVFVDLSALQVARKSNTVGAALPLPPKGLPAETFRLPEIPERTLENSASPEVVKPQEDAAEAQAQALKTISKRLTKIYARQIELFAAQQTALLGDPDAARIAELAPELDAAFQRYAKERLPLITRFAYLAGVPDNNPTNEPPPASMRTVPKQRWREAMGLRTSLNALDSSYSAEANAIIAKAGKLADQDRLANLKKIEDYRRQMMERALDEAVNPLRSRQRPAVLRLNAAPEIVLPEQPARSVNIPATETLPPPPQVEFEGSGESARVSGEFLRRQLAIWAAINRFRVVQHPSVHARDATKDFERWRTQQKVGL